METQISWIVLSGLFGILIGVFIAHLMSGFVNELGKDCYVKLKNWHTSKKTKKIEAENKKLREAKIKEQNAKFETELTESIQKYPLLDIDTKHMLLEKLLKTEFSDDLVSHLNKDVLIKWVKFLTSILDKESTKLRSGGSTKLQRIVLDTLLLILRKFEDESHQTLSNVIYPTVSNFHINLIESIGHLSLDIVERDIQLLSETDQRAIASLLKLVDVHKPDYDYIHKTLDQVLRSSYIARNHSEQIISELENLKKNSKDQETINRINKLLRSANKL